MEYILIIIAFNLILYFRTLRFSICVDDIRWYKKIQDGLLDNQKFWPPSALISTISSRLYGGGLLGRAKAGEAPDAHLDHAVTMFLHTLASVLVYFAFGKSQVSFWAAILYSCNPVNLQTSVWLNGRRYLVNVILVLAMVLLSGIKYGWLVSLPLYAMTGMFHFTAVFAPVFFLGWYSVPVGLAFYLLFRDTINSKIEARYKTIHSLDWKMISWKRAIVVVKCYGFHFFKMLYPGTILMNYPTLFWWGVTKEGNKDAYAFNFEFFTGLLAVGITGLMLAVVPAYYKWYVVFLFLATLQWCAIIPAVQLLADRYVSTALPFMMFFLAMFTPWWVCAIIAGFYVARLWSAMEMFTSIWHYYKYQMYHAPHITTPRKDLVNYCMNMGDHLSAWHHTREGLTFTPNDFSLLHRAAVCAKACGSRKQALEYVAKAEQNMYLDQEEGQKKWCDEFKAQMKKEDWSTPKTTKK